MNIFLFLCLTVTAYHHVSVFSLDCLWVFWCSLLISTSLSNHPLSWTHINTPQTVKLYKSRIKSSSQPIIITHAIRSLMTSFCNHLVILQVCVITCAYIRCMFTYICACASAHGTCQLTLGLLLRHSLLRVFLG